jgi:hypothetical protein
MFLCQIFVIIIKMIKIWLKEDPYVLLLYFGVVDESTA